MDWRLTLCVVSSIVAAVFANGEYLLPGDVIPRHYDVRYTFDIDPTSNFSFYGIVDILLSAKKPTSKIVLHAQDLEIVKELIKIEGPSAIKVHNTKLNDTFNFLTLTLDDDLMQNVNYTLTIPFYGNLQQGLDGVYVSSYISKHTSAKEYLVTTQFEAISARKGFPCFDEPMYKATFRLNIGHHKNFTAVSNMPLYNTTSNNVLELYWPWSMVGNKFKKDLSEFVWDQFENSVPMSTYLIAFVISKFSHVESPAGLSTTKFKIWARSDAIDQTSYAATIGPKVLSHFEGFFNVSFPLPKQDMFAIPDFAAGAMENWGLITYRETALLYDKEQSSFLNKERVAEVIAHELAHQWFGNLVTMKWWSDLWLNEGFATYVASVGVNAVEPEWRADINYAVENIMSVLALDSLQSSHPVSVPIDDPKRISEIFDEISYRKGAALIRMMTMFLGEDVFRKALNRYLVKYSYQNAEQDDLWSELTEVNRQRGGLTRNVTVKQVMDTWTKQTGYPLVTAIRNYDDNTLVLTQKRFLSLAQKSTAPGSWWVPLNVRCQGDRETSREVQWLAEHEGTTSHHVYSHGANAGRWVLFNADMIAPYRVNYDPRNWQLLITTLTEGSYSSIPTLGRVQLISDAFALAATDHLDYTTAIKLASYLQRETEYLPLSIGLTALAKIENVLKRTPDYGAFQKFVRKLITDTYERVGGLATKRILNGDDLNSVKMQVATSSWACRMNVPGCEENAIELFQQWMDTPKPDEHNPIPLDLRKTVYCVAASRGGVRQWRFLVTRRQRVNVAAARDALLHSLACTRDVWILTQYLEWAITEGSEVRRQDAASVIIGVTRSTVGYYVAKDFIYSRIQDIHNAFRSQRRRLGGIIKTLLNQFTKQRELDEFLKWRDENAKYLDETKLAVEQAIEKAKVNIDWINRNRKLVVEKLREFSNIPPRHHRAVLPQKGQMSFMYSIFAIHNISSIRLRPYTYLSEIR